MGLTMKSKEYSSIEEIISTLRKECNSSNPDGSRRFPIDWALTYGTVAYLCDQLERLLEKEKEDAFENGVAKGVNTLSDVVMNQGFYDHSPNDWKKVNEVLHRVHDFLGTLCRDGRCDEHCSACIQASDLADDVWEVMDKEDKKVDGGEKND